MHLIVRDEGLGLLQVVSSEPCAPQLAFTSVYRKSVGFSRCCFALIFFSYNNLCDPFVLLDCPHTQIILNGCNCYETPVAFARPKRFTIGSSFVAPFQTLYCPATFPQNIHVTCPCHTNCNEYQNS